MISVDRKWKHFPVKLKLGIKKESFKKNLIDLIETIHQINMISEHSISSNNLFTSHLNAYSFNMFLIL